MRTDKRETAELTFNQEIDLKDAIEVAEETWNVLPHPLQQKFIAMHAWNYDQDVEVIKTLNATQLLLQDLAEQLLVIEQKEKRERIIHHIIMLTHIHEFFAKLIELPCLVTGWS